MSYGPIHVGLFFYRHISISSRQISNFGSFLLRTPLVVEFFVTKRILILPKRSYYFLTSVLIELTFDFISVQVVVLLYTSLAPSGVGQGTAISSRDLILRPGARTVKRKTVLKAHSMIVWVRPTNTLTPFAMIWRGKSIRKHDTLNDERITDDRFQ